MARLWSSGAELNSLTAGVEITSVTGAPTISTTHVRSGTYAFRCTSTNLVNIDYKASATQGVFYHRVYFYLASLPTVIDGNLVHFSAPGLGGTTIQVGLRTTGAIFLWKAPGGGAQIGSDTAPLSTGTWYQLEVKIDSTTLSATAVDARLNGVSFASGTVNLVTAHGGIRIGNNSGGIATYDVYFDDIAVNDSTGSFQNSWPGPGSIIHLKPNAVGDNSDWTQSTGSGTNNYEFVDEVTPDDATTSLTTGFAGKIDDYNIEDTPAAIATADTINLVQVGVRWREDTSSTTKPTMRLRIKATASGTVEETADITVSGTTWATNSTSAPSNYQLTLYDLPGASTGAWTKTLLDSTQIGLNLTNTPQFNCQVSTIWLLVESTIPLAITLSTGMVQGVKLYTP